MECRIQYSASRCPSSLVGIELMHMLRKGQLAGEAERGLSLFAQRGQEGRSLLQVRGIKAFREPRIDLGQ